MLHTGRMGVGEEKNSPPKSPKICFSVCKETVSHDLTPKSHHPPPNCQKSPMAEETVCNAVHKIKCYDSLTTELKIINILNKCSNDNHLLHLTDKKENSPQVKISETNAKIVRHFTEKADDKNKNASEMHRKRSSRRWENKRKTNCSD